MCTHPRALSIFFDYLAGKKSVRQIAKEVGISPSNVSRHFHRHFGNRIDTDKLRTYCLFRLHELEEIAQKEGKIDSAIRAISKLMEKNGLPQNIMIQQNIHQEQKIDLSAYAINITPERRQKILTALFQEEEVKRE